MNYRDSLKDKKRIVVKIGSSSLVHKNTGYLDLSKLEKFVCKYDAKDWLSVK